MSKPRRRKQKKQVKPELKLRQFAATELSDQLAAQHSAADLPRFMVDTVAGAYVPADAELMIEGFGAAATPGHAARQHAQGNRRGHRCGARCRRHRPQPRHLVPRRLHPARGPGFRPVGSRHLPRRQDLPAEPVVHDAAAILGAQAGEDILDMCAAPGGKTTQIAALTQGQAHLTACEMSIPRAEKLEANLHRQGAKNVPVLRTDARELDEFFRFDRILLDAPCTGTGTVISGNEKSLRGLTEQLLVKCARSQRALLDRAMGASNRAARSSIRLVRSCRRKTRTPCKRPSTSIWTASSSPRRHAKRK